MKRMGHGVYLLCFGVLSIFCVSGVSVVAKEDKTPGFERMFSLSGNDWRICADADGKGRERRMFDAEASASEWILASVPGNIQADLEAAHLLKPLWYGTGRSATGGSCPEGLVV